MGEESPAFDLVTVRDARAVTNSLIVADRFGKLHKDVLRAISNVDASDDFARRNFAPGDYLDANGQRRPMMELTRDGAMVLIMGFTGAEAARWKERFLKAFNAAERRLLHCQAPDACAAKGAGLCRSCHYKALTVDPAFAAAHRARSSARMKALHADRAFAAAHRARCSAHMKALHADPAFAAANRARTIALNAARRERAKAAQRPCLRCGASFASSGPGNRICARCKSDTDDPGRAFEGVAL